MSSDLVAIESRLWATADQLWANTGLKPSEFFTPVLGLIFLRYADHKFAQAEHELKGKKIGGRPVSKIDYQARGGRSLPEAARCARLLALPEGADIGQAINDAMRAVEAENEALKLGAGYDHCWVLREGAGVRHAATLHDPKSGRNMEIFTD